MNTFSHQQLQRFIAQHQLEAEILPMDRHTRTVPDAAEALGVAEEQIIKSLVFMVNGEPLLVINNGPARVSYPKVAAHLGVGRKKVRFAAAEQALEITGYVVGSMPPFGHRQKLRTLVDTAVTELELIYGGGGDVNAMLRLTPAELLRVTGAEVLPLS